MNLLSIMESPCQKEDPDKRDKTYGDFGYKITKDFLKSLENGMKLLQVPAKLIATLQS